MFILPLPFCSPDMDLSPWDQVRVTGCRPVASEEGEGGPPRREVHSEDIREGFLGGPALELRPPEGLWALVAWRAEILLMVAPARPHG